MLKQRGADVAPQLATFVTDLPQGHPDYEHYLLEALWTCQALNIVDSALLDRVLAARDSRARAAAVRVLASWQGRLPSPLEQLAEAVADESAPVRLEAVRALAGLNSLEAAQAAMRVLDQPMDRFLDHALYLTLKQLQPVWLPVLEKGGTDFAADPRKLAAAMVVFDSNQAVGPLLNLLNSGKLPPQRPHGSPAVTGKVWWTKGLGACFRAGR